MPIGLSPQSLFFSLQSIFISLQTCFNFASFSVAPSLSLSLFPFSSCHICSLLRFPLYFLVSLAHTSSPSLSLFLSSFFLLRHLHCSLSQSFCDSLMYFSCLFRFNIPLFPHPVIFFLLPAVFCCRGRQRVLRLKMKTHGTFTLTLMHFWTSTQQLFLYRTAQPVPSWETANR